MLELLQMMLLGGASSSSVEARELDRRKPAGFGPASDVWSLGCLLYELLTGQYLFDPSDDKWAQSFLRVTSPSLDLFTRDVLFELSGAEPEALLYTGGPGPHSPIISLLSLMLERDPTRRPLIPAVIARVDRMIASVS